MTKKLAGYHMNGQLSKIQKKIDQTHFVWIPVGEKINLQQRYSFLVGEITSYQVIGRAASKHIT